jgi:hypothetical protein
MSRDGSLAVLFVFKLQEILLANMHEFVLWDADAALGGKGEEVRLIYL